MANRRQHLLERAVTRIVIVDVVGGQQGEACLAGEVCLPGQVGVIVGTMMNRGGQIAAAGEHFAVERQCRLKLVSFALAHFSLSPCTQGERVGVRGFGVRRAKFRFWHGTLNPLTPNPSPPEYRGRGE
jgi:hypothetical protein